MTLDKSTGDNSTGPIVLAIETAGSACSVAVGRGAKVLAAERQGMRYGHAEALLPMVDRVVVASGLPRSAFEAVAVAVGPGGFTGIRAGIGAAQGIALGLNAQLIGVTSFAAVAAAVPAGVGRLLVALESRREDLYVALFDRGSGLPLAEPAAVMPDDLAEYAAALVGEGPLLSAGDAAEAAAAALGGRFGMEIAESSAPDARGVLAAALRQIAAEPGESRARPLYLRPPDVTFPKSVPPARTARR